MKRLNYLRAGLLCMLLALFAGMPGFAQTTTPAPTNLEGTYTPKLPDYSVLLSWIYNNNGGQPGHGQNQVVTFKFYHAYGQTTNLNEFSYLSADSTYSPNSPLKLATAIRVDSVGMHSFYVTATINGVESSPSNMIHVNIAEVPRIEITTTEAPETAVINQVYTYDFDATSTAPNDSIYFQILGNTGSIEMTTGVFTWTPTQAGEYNFSVRARGLDPQSYDFYSWKVHVSNCSQPTTLSGTVVDQHGVSITSGFVSLYARPDSGKHSRNDYYDAEIENGQYTFSNIEEGEYIISAQGDNFYLPWDSTGNTNIISITCGDTKTANLVVKTFSNRQLYVISKPSGYAAVNVQYNYQLELFDSDSTTTHTYKYELKDPNMHNASVDENTGLFTWTPTAAGDYNFHIKVWDVNDPDVYDGHTFTITVLNCASPSVLNLTVKYEGTDSLVPYGRAYLVFDKDSGCYQEHRAYMSTLSDGVMSLTNVPDGTYYLSFVEYNYYDQPIGDDTWYENATGKDDATPIIITCGDTINITMYIKPVTPPVERTISGTVINAATGLPIKGAIVEIASVGTKNNYSFSSVATDANGNYSIAVYDNAEYRVRANGFVYDSALTPIDQRLYSAMYYNQTTNITEAEILELDSNLTGINFSLNALPVYNNSISGTIIDSDGSPIENANVLAILVNSGNQGNTHAAFDGTTDDQGHYTISNLELGTYVVFAFDGSKNNYVSGYYLADSAAAWTWASATQLTIDATTTLTGIDVQLGKSRTMFGRGRMHGYIGGHKGKIVAKTLAKESLAGVNVYLYDNKGEAITTTQTDTKGEFVFDKLTVGKYIVKADKVGYENMVTNVEIVSEDEVVSTDLAMEEGSATGINDSDLMNIGVYPNPVTERIIVSFSGVAGNSLISIVNTNGVEIKTTSVNTVTGLNSVELTNLNIPAGVYFVRVTNGESSSAIPFVVSK